MFLIQMIFRVGRDRLFLERSSFKVPVETLANGFKALVTLYPKFDHENISEISSSTSGVLFMILALSYIGLMLMLGARPLYVHLNEKFLFKSIGGLEVPVCYALILFSPGPLPTSRCGWESVP